jgi:hypothetical protein
MDASAHPATWRLQHVAVENLGHKIEAFPVEKMDEKVVLPFGGGMEKTFAELSLMNYWNTVYHEDQINLLLQAVFEWHLPELEKHIFEAQKRDLGATE